MLRNTKGIHTLLQTAKNSPTKKHNNKQTFIDPSFYLTLHKWLPDFTKLHQLFSKLIKQTPATLRSMFANAEPYEKAVVSSQLAALALKGIFLVAENPLLAVVLLTLYRLNPVGAEQFFSPEDWQPIQWTSQLGQRLSYFDASGSYVPPNCYYRATPSPEYDCMKFEVRDINVYTTLFQGGIEAIGTNISNPQFPIAIAQPSWRDTVIFPYVVNYTNAHRNQGWGLLDCSFQHDIIFNSQYQFTLKPYLLYAQDNAMCEAYNTFIVTYMLPLINNTLALGLNNTSDSSNTGGDDAEFNWPHAAIIFAAAVVFGLALRFGYRYYKNSNKEEKENRITEKPMDAFLDISIEDAIAEGGPNRKRLSSLVESINDNLFRLKDSQDTSFDGYTLQLQFLQEAFQTKLQKFANAFGMEIDSEFFPLDKPVQVVLENGSLSKQIYDYYLLSDSVIRKQKLDPEYKFIDIQSNQACQMNDETVEVRDTEIAEPVTLWFRRHENSELEKVEGIFEDKLVGNFHPYLAFSLAEKRPVIDPDEIPQPFHLEQEIDKLVHDYREQLIKLNDEINSQLTKQFDDEIEERKDDSTPPATPASSQTPKFKFSREGKSGMIEPLLKEQVVETPQRRNI